MRIAHRIAIAAPAADVWRVLSDVEGWPAWLPTVTAARGLHGPRLTAGNRFRLTQPAQRAAVWRVDAVRLGTGFSWRREDGVFAAYHRIEPRGAGCAVHTVLMGRAISPLLWGALRPLLTLAVAAEGHALRRACAARRGPSGPPRITDDTTRPRHAAAH